MQHLAGLSPERESRPALVEAGRLPMCQLGGDKDLHSALHLQTQRLVSRFRLSPALAEVVAVLIYGGRGDD